MYLPESGQGSVGTLPAEGHILYAPLIWYSLAFVQSSHTGKGSAAHIVGAVLHS